ncbi:hypothetical protein [Streptomyces sp. NPDC088258]|uniref:hypothetical protein n=1 Tax=Streptomyces sp. NPDC088258 TaxID=3365849 RepID=UPI003802D2F1
MICAKGGHDFPIEDEVGACCPERGVTLLYRGGPISPDDLAHDHPERPSWLALGPVLEDDGPRPH